MIPSLMSMLGVPFDGFSVKHPKEFFVGRRLEQTKSGRRREVIRVSDEKRSRYTGAMLRELRAKRGVGPVRQISA